MLNASYYEELLGLTQENWRPLEEQQEPPYTTPVDFGKDKHTLAKETTVDTRHPPIDSE